MIDLVGKKYWFFLISAIIIVAGLISLGVFGLKLGVDFSSGTAMTVKFDKNIELAQLRDAMSGLGYPKATLQPTGSEFFIRLTSSTTGGALTADETTAITSGLEKALAVKVTIQSLYSVSPVVAEGTIRNTIIAIAVTAVGILLYLAWAFRKMPKPFSWGTCAVIALVHDILIVVSVFSILGWLLNVEVDALFVTGVLAVVGISVNNIVVVFDRIRENVKRGASKNFIKVANFGLNESIGRSLNTSLATLFVIVAMLLLGGTTIFNLVLVLLIGIATGIYSSLCIAGQLLVVWETGELGKLSSKNREQKKLAA